MSRIKCGWRAAAGNGWGQHTPLSQTIKNTPMCHSLLHATHVQYRLRLTGIDAPESHQPYGQASRQHLAERVAGKDVTLPWQKRDPYRHLLGRVEFDGGDMNLEQLRAGYAWHYLRYAAGQPTQERADYAQAEGQARRERVGLWQESRPMAPWDYRHRARGAP